MFTALAYSILILLGIALTFVLADSFAAAFTKGKRR